MEGGGGWAGEVNRVLGVRKLAREALLHHAPGYESVGSDHPITLVGSNEWSDSRGGIGTEGGRPSKFEEYANTERTIWAKFDPLMGKIADQTTDRAWKTHQAMWTQCATPHCEYTFQRDGVWSGAETLKDLDAQEPRRNGEHNRVHCPRCRTWTCSDCGASPTLRTRPPRECNPTRWRGQHTTQNRTERDRRRDVA